MKLKTLLKVVSGIVLLCLITTAAIYSTNFWVKTSTKHQLYSDINLIPKNKVGLLLGTAKYTKAGTKLNQYYKYRIEAAVKLYNEKKIEYILVSGDNRKKNYDEPTTMRDDLIKKGIPSNRIFLDYAGFRTLDSVVRSKEIFGQTEITVISQKFHNERALFIAKRKGINAIGFNAKDVSQKYGAMVQKRELLARVKTIIDLVFGKTPKFLGSTIEIKTNE